jgi:hypothetical protein
MAGKLFPLCLVQFFLSIKVLRTLCPRGNKFLSYVFPRECVKRTSLTFLSAGTTTKGMVGFFLYIITYLPVIVFIRPHKLEKFMWPAFIGTVGTVFGIMAWAVHNNSGSAGDLVHPGIAITSSARGFRFVQCISAVAGTYGGAADRISDVRLFLSSHLHSAAPNFISSRLLMFMIRSGRDSRRRKTHTLSVPRQQCLSQSQYALSSVSSQQVRLVQLTERQCGNP